MGINEFMTKVCSAVKKLLGEEYLVELKPVRKNNGVMLHGLLISLPGQKVIPRIYLDDYWEAYRCGRSFADVIRDLMKVYREGSLVKNIDMNFFRNFDRVKERICYRLIRQRGNEELLGECPHVEFLDLALCFYYVCEKGFFGRGSILINNTHARLWEKKTVDLMRCAEQNTGKLFPWECIPMKSLIGKIQDFKERDQLFSRDENDSFFEECPIQILTNTEQMQGAAVMLYPGVLEEIAKKERRNLYILPSSVHEVIILPETGRETADVLREMVCEVNRTQVAPEEVLSDNLYYFDLMEKKIKII